MKLYTRLCAAHAHYITFLTNTCMRAYENKCTHTHTHARTQMYLQISHFTVPATLVSKGKCHFSWLSLAHGSVNGCTVFFYFINVIIIIIYSITKCCTCHGDANLLLLSSAWQHLKPTTIHPTPSFFCGRRKTAGREKRLTRQRSENTASNLSRS